jgi:chromosome partitioning protein
MNGNSKGQGLVLVVGMLKGGVGKTTSAMFSALHYAEQGKDVTVLDGDQTSQSAYDWGRLAKAAGDPLPYEVVRFPFADDIAAEARRLREANHVVIIDAGGGSAQYLEEACTEADVLLMPMAPTGADARRLAATLQSAERAAARNPRGLVAFVTLVRAEQLV